MGVCRGHGGYTGICIWAVAQMGVCRGVKLGVGSEVTFLTTVLRSIV